jgi:hypothetical protein
MSNKVFYGILALLAAGALGFFVLQKEPPPARLGVEQADEGREHVADGTQVQYKNKIPTSGPHYVSPAPWRAYDEQLPNEVIVHNMEHGGIIVSYRPDIDPATVQKLKELLYPPYTVKEFTPTKVVLMPRAEQEKPILLASWNRLMELDEFDQQTIIDYYKTNIGKSPEPSAS